MCRSKFSSTKTDFLFYFVIIIFKAGNCFVSATTNQEGVYVFCSNTFLCTEFDCLIFICTTVKQTRNLHEKKFSL